MTMPVYTITATRSQEVVARVFAVDEDHLDDAVADLAPDDFTVITTNEVENFNFEQDFEVPDEY
jgi:hypothetical protein